MLKRLNKNKENQVNLETVESWTIKELTDNYTPEGWEKVFNQARDQDEFVGISRILEKEEKKYGQSLPRRCELFTALDKILPSKVRVVIIGQDPYHQLLSGGLPRAVGLSFAGRKNDSIPRSLGNIYKEIKNCYPEFKTPSHPDISCWCDQGVMLLNACFTVRKGQAGEHRTMWMALVKLIIKEIERHRKGLIFLLWGQKAQDLEKEIGDRSVILKATHPSPFSAHKKSKDAPAFLGCGHFKTVNDLLIERNEKSIDWSVV